MPATRPNILLITTDQQRYDTLACNGNEIIRTPVLDALAGEGCRFERPYINNPVCIPSRACIQTGRYTHQHGVRYQEANICSTRGLPPWEQTFMERLLAAGYNTGAVGKMHMFPPKGFHEAHLTNGKGARWRVPYGSPLGPSQLGDEYAGWLEARHPGGYALIYEQRRSESYRRSRGIVANVLPTEEYIDTWTTENAMQFIARERDTPFFLWYGFCNPHGPIDPPQEYAELYRPEDMELTERYLRRATPDRGPSEEHVRRFLAHYYGLCTYVDDMLAKVFSLLKEKGLWDNTLIIFTADHGEMAGDHGRFSKGNFYEPVIRVPLIIKPPAGNTYLPVVSDMVETIDIAPTILDYAKLPIPETVQGISLRSVMEGRTRGKEAILCEFTPNDQSSNGKCIRSERYKYEYWAPNGPAKLFDLQEDSHELRNLIDDPAYTTVKIEMQQRLIHHLALSEKPVLYP